MIKINYKIFDLRHKTLTHRYKLNKQTSAAQKGEVFNNRSIITKECLTDDVLILNQVHGINIVDADDIVDFDNYPEADGAITSRSKIVLAIQTADCVPILAFCQKSNIIGAAHAGWPSAFGGIVVNLISTMKAKGAADIEAIIGPCIRQKNYEVQEDFRSRFIEQNKTNEQFFIKSKRDYHYMFNLPAYVILQLEENGVINIKDLQQDTYSNPDKYPSYRRSFHKDEVYNQNLLSTIFMHDV